jgi:hypothetical protein
MPIRYRRWFLDRLVEEIKSSNENRKSATERSGPREIPINQMMENIHNEATAPKNTSPKKFK